MNENLFTEDWKADMMKRDKEELVSLLAQTATDRNRYDSQVQALRKSQTILSEKLVNLANHDKRVDILSQILSGMDFKTICSVDDRPYLIKNAIEFTDEIISQINKRGINDTN